MDSARRVIKRMLNPRFLSSSASYDEASIIRHFLPPELARHLALAAAQVMLPAKQVHRERAGPLAPGASTVLLDVSTFSGHVGWFHRVTVTKTAQVEMRNGRVDRWTRGGAEEWRSGGA